MSEVAFHKLRISTSNSEEIANLAATRNHPSPSRDHIISEVDRNVRSHQFQKAGGSMVMLAKGNRSAGVTRACESNGGFYLGSIGGPAARLAQDCIKHIEVIDFPDDGMEAVWMIQVEDFPAFIVVDDKGNDFFAETLRPIATTIPVGPPA